MLFEYLSEEECKNIISKKTCKYGTITKNKNVFQTHNKVVIDLPNQFTSLMGPRKTQKKNCMLQNVNIFSHYESNTAKTALVDLSHCKYTNGECRTDNNKYFIGK